MNSPIVSSGSIFYLRSCNLSAHRLLYISIQVILRAMIHTGPRLFYIEILSAPLTKQIRHGLLATVRTVLEVLRVLSSIVLSSLGWMLGIHSLYILLSGRKRRKRTAFSAPDPVTEKPIIIN